MIKRAYAGKEVHSFLFYSSTARRIRDLKGGGDHSKHGKIFDSLG
jgi:hypothetical protein